MSFQLSTPGSVAEPFSLPPECSHLPAKIVRTLPACSARSLCVVGPGRRLRAVALEAENEVCWYRLAKIQRSLGNVAEQQKALAEYQRLHEIANQQKEVEPVFSLREATKQQVDP